MNILEEFGNIICEGMKLQSLEANSKLLEIESLLIKYSYMSKKSLPGSADALVYLKLRKIESTFSQMKKCRLRKNTSTSIIGT